MIVKRLLREASSAVLSAPVTVQTDKDLRIVTRVLENGGDVLIDTCLPGKATTAGLTGDDIVRTVRDLLAKDQIADLSHFAVKLGEDNGDWTDSMVDGNHLTMIVSRY